MDDARQHADSHGVELPDDHEAADHAAHLSAAILNEDVRTTGTRTVSVTVRRQDGSVVYTSHGTFTNVFA